MLLINMEYNQPHPQNPGFQPPQNKGLATASLVLGIVALLSSCFPYVPFLFAVVAVVLSIVSLKKYPYGSAKGLAIGGLITALIALVIGTIIAVSYSMFFWEILEDMYHYTYF